MTDNPSDEENVKSYPDAFFEHFYEVAKRSELVECLKLHRERLFSLLRELDLKNKELVETNEIARELICERDELRRWVDDLQSGMYVNCVYCGHRYGPGETTPVSMADALKAHVEQCPKHPMSACARERDRMRSALEPFGAFADVLDEREMNERHPTAVGVYMLGQNDDGCINLTGEEADSRRLFGATASAYGTPASYMARLSLGDFRRARAALQQEKDNV